MADFSSAGPSLWCFAEQASAVLLKTRCSFMEICVVPCDSVYRSGQLLVHFLRRLLVGLAMRRYSKSCWARAFALW